MLARTDESKILTDEFLSLSALRLSQVEFDALIKTLELIESGELSSRRFTYIGDERVVFDMDSWNTGRYIYKADFTPECGTAACIGGTAALISGDDQLFQDIRLHMGKNINLYNLFYGYNNIRGKITPKRAGQKLREYLTTGECKSPWFAE